MVLTIRNLPLIGFLGADANRGPVRYEDHLWITQQTNKYTQVDSKNILWECARFYLEDLPEQLDQVNEEGLRRIKGDYVLLDDDGTYMPKESFITFLKGNPNEQEDLEQGIFVPKLQTKIQTMFGTFNVILSSLLPIQNLISGIAKIAIAIINDGSFFGVLEEDRGWKFRVTLIAVGLAEIFFLGLLVHGIASLYFAATTLDFRTF